MINRILGLGDEDQSLVHNTRTLTQKAPSKSSPNAITFYSTRSTGSFAIGLFTSTSFAKIIWWTGEEEIVTANNPAVSITKAATASPTIKPITVFSCTSTGIPSGYFINVRALNASNALIHIDLTQLKRCDSLEIGSLTNSNVLYPEKLQIQYGSEYRNLIGFNTINASSLSNCILNINLHSSVTGLQIYLGSGNSSLTLRTAYANTPSPINIPILPLGFAGFYSVIGVLFTSTLFNFSSLSFSSLQLSNTNATEVLLNYALTPTADLSSNSALSSVRCKDCVFTGYLSKKNSKVEGGLNVSNCNLSASALNVMFEDLGTVSPSSGFIQVQGNPGALTCNTSIATAKGYVVITQ